MAHIELTSEENSAVIEALNDRLGSLREQVYHSDTSHFKDGLKHQETVLRGAIAKHEAAEWIALHVDRVGWHGRSLRSGLP